MSGYQNYCELYYSLIPYHHNIRTHCENLSNVLKSKKEERQQKKSEKFKQNVQKFLKDLINKLFENLELLKMVAFDLGTNYVTVQCNLKAIEKESDNYHEMLNAINRKINDQHKNANFNVHSTREEFVKKFKELLNAKCLYEDIQKKLDENCKIKLGIEEKFSCKKEELKKVLCQIKKQREAIQPNVPMSAFDELRNSYEKAVLKANQLSSTVDCYHTKLAETERENELMRQTFKSQLKVIREHDNWSTKELMKRKNILENKIRCICVDDSDCEISKIEQEIFIMQQKIDIAEVGMRELNNFIEKMQAWKRPCPNLSPEKLKLLKEEKAPIFGIDYQGSKFIKLKQ